MPFWQLYFSPVSDVEHSRLLGSPNPEARSAAMDAPSTRSKYAKYA
jgi:hypothetical protein